MLSLIGIIVGLAVVIWLTAKGINPILASLAACVVILLCSGMPVVESLTGIYQTSFGGFVSAYILLLLLGAAYGYLMEKSGCAAAVANVLIRAFGRYAVYSIPVIIALLIYGGIIALVCIFVMLPIMIRIFREYNIPRWFMPVMIQFGGGTFSNSGIGSPSILNVVVSSTLGVAPSAGGFPAVMGMLACFVSGMLFLKYYLDKARKEGQGYVPHAMDEKTSVQEDALPSPIIGFLVLASVPVCINLTWNGTNIFSPVSSMAIGCGLCILLNLKRLDLKTFFFKEATSRFTSAMWMAACMGAMSGFGAIVAATPGYQRIIDFALNIPGSPYFKLIVATNILAVATGSATAACVIIAPQLGPVFVGMGMPAAHVARIMAQAGTALDSLPNNGGILSIMQVCGVSVKESYRPFVPMTIIAPLIGAVVTALFCMI